MKLPLLTLAAGLLLAAGCKKDDTSLPVMQLSGTMSGANETPAVTTSATGAVSGTYDPNTKVMTYTVTYAGLTPIAGHFHKGAAGVSGPVSIVYPNNLASPITATVTLTQEQADALTAGMLYANLHTQANPNGEIRANVVAK